MIEEKDKRSSLRGEVLQAETRAQQRVTELTERLNDRIPVA